MLTCKKAINQISNYLDGDLDEELKHTLETHLTKCHHCHAVFDTTKKTIELYCDGKLFSLPRGSSHPSARGPKTQAAGALVNSLKKVGFSPIQNKGRVWFANARGSAGGGLRESLGSVVAREVAPFCGEPPSGWRSRPPFERRMRGLGPSPRRTEMDAGTVAGQVNRDALKICGRSIPWAGCR